MSRNVCGIMIKYPEPGRVKTRLAREIGPEKAAMIFRQMAERVLEQTAPAAEEFDRFIFYDPPERIRDFMSWRPREKFIAQTGGDVGERMGNAIRHLLENGAEKAVVTGADIPELSCGIIMQAFDMMEKVDVVIGPAGDGGYYLIGMKSELPEVFINIPWGTGDVYSKTVGVIKRVGSSCGILPTLQDIDTIDDLGHFDT